MLPQALDRHLKSIHYLSRAERKPYVDKARRLGLANLQNVIYPEPGSNPISGLPTSNGYARDFEACGYPSVTAKRMQAHWRTAHPQARGVEGFRCRSVGLQTFFRGSSLQYFIVGDSATDCRSQEVDAGNGTFTGEGPATRQQ